MDTSMLQELLKSVIDFEESGGSIGVNPAATMHGRLALGR